MEHCVVVLYNHLFLRMGFYASSDGRIWGESMAGPSVAIAAMHDCCLSPRVPFDGSIQSVDGRPPHHPHNWFVYCHDSLPMNVLLTPIFTDGWKMVHAHFLQMGGIIFRINGDLKYLEIEDLLSESPQDIEHCKAQEELRKLSDPITTAEITDHSKSDVLTKALALLQTAWFITSFVARRVQSLPHTALEVMTLTYAVLCIVIFCFWWDKPLDVQCPRVITLSLPVAGSSPIPHPAELQSTSSPSPPDSLQAVPSQATSTNPDPHSQSQQALSVGSPSPGSEPTPDGSPLPPSQLPNCQFPISTILSAPQPPGSGGPQPPSGSQQMPSESASPPESSSESTTQKKPGQSKHFFNDPPTFLLTENPV